MCGITGYIDFGNSSQPGVLERMTETIEHRGPDDKGFEFREMDGAQIGFGFRRLSVIDLSMAGHQPMVNETNGDMIVFNGEVYNYKSLRQELEARGHRFNSNTDTEVVLRSFQEWGVRCVDKFIGMFAIVILHRDGGKIHVFGDRPGIKPFYYYWDGNIFLFASELKAFHMHPGFKKEIDFDTLGTYFHHGYIPAPYCIFRNTAKIEPGHRMEIDLKSKTISHHNYWSVLNVFNRPKLDISFEEATTELERILTEACLYRMIADVPVGVFLSGGYDSTCVTALIQKNSSRKIKTFTIAFENEEFNEGPYAREVSDYLGTEHTEYLLKEQDALELIPMMPDIYDEPLSDGGAIPNVLVALLASNHVKVVLSADGGDEIFAGYTKHYYLKQQYKRYFRIPSVVRRAMVTGIDIINRSRSAPLYHFDRLTRLRTFLDAKDASELFDRLNQTFTLQDIQRFMKQPFVSQYSNFMNDHLLNKSNNEVDRATAIDFQTFLAGDILPKVDRATSFASIEGREPLLDHRVIEFAATLPSDFKLRNQEGKAILRNVVHKYVPKKLLDRPKKGFGLPLHRWAMKELRPLFDESFDKHFLQSQEIFSVSNIRALYNHYQNGHVHSFDRIYELFVFQQWYKRWMM